MSDDSLALPLAPRTRPGISGRQPLGPLVAARPAPLVGLEHYPGGRYGPYLSGLLGALLGRFGPELVPWGGPLAAELCLLAPLLLGLWLPPHLIPWWQRMRMARAPAWDGSGEPPAAPVKVEGVVRVLDPPFLVPGAHDPVVYARTRYRQGGADGRPTSSGREDIRGVRFQIVLPTGVSVHIDPTDAWLLDGEVVVREVGTSVRWALGAPWAGRRRSKLHRSSLGPGDRLEAVGVLVRQVDVEGQAAPGRGVPMVYLMRPVWSRGVWIRRR